MKKTKEIKKSNGSPVGASIARPQLQRLALNKGITLLALVITIVLMLILASVAVTVAINGGLFEYAGRAKHVTEDTREKEEIQQAIIIAEGQSKTGRITVEEMQKALNKVLGEGVATAISNGDTIAIKFEETGIYYNADFKGNSNVKIEQFTTYEDTTPGVLAQNSDGAHMIESIEDLVVFSAIINGYSDENINKPSPWSNSIVLMRDLDFKSTLSYDDSTTTKYNAYLGIEDEDVTLMEALTNTVEYKGFIPIGNETNKFSGTFDGQNHYIRNLCEKTDTYAGLFGYINFATVKNITVTGNVESTSYAGGVAGYVVSSQWDTYPPLKIINCKNYVNVESPDYAGGIVGYGSGRFTTIIQCVNFGDISSTSYAGGIAGFCSGWKSNSFIFTENANYGKVMSDKYAGGLAGEIEGVLFIHSCINGKTAVINCTSSEGAVGGIIGVNGTGAGSGAFYNSLNLGSVSSESFSGGILGSSRDWTATMINCFSGGKISGSYPGGILGQRNWGSSDAATGVNCYYLLSDTVTKSVGRTGQSMNAQGVNQLTQTHIDSLNNYIEQDPDEIGTTGWVKWILDGNGDPTLDFTTTWDASTKTWIEE